MSEQEYRKGLEDAAKELARRIKNNNLQSSLYGFDGIVDWTLETYLDQIKREHPTAQEIEETQQWLAKINGEAYATPETVMEFIRGQGPRKIE